ncbi:MAG: CoA transferase, partial [Burkholderiaceae bacterium]|nr:CoA transferase [Burkholderiaceae bacterium]
TEGQRDHIIVAVGNDAQFERFCQVIGRPDLAADARYAKNADRVRHRAELVPLLAAVLRTRPKAEWLTAFEAAKVPCGPINDLAEVFADPQVQARAMVDRWPHPLLPPGTEQPLGASPLKLSATPAQRLRPPPLLGQHTDWVLQHLLGKSDGEIAALRSAGVVG